MSDELEVKYVIHGSWIKWNVYITYWVQGARMFNNDIEVTYNWTSLMRVKRCWTKRQALKYVRARGELK